MFGVSTKDLKMQYRSSGQPVHVAESRKIKDLHQEKGNIDPFSLPEYIRSCYRMGVIEYALLSDSTSMGIGRKRYNSNRNFIG